MNERKPANAYKDVQIRTANQIRLIVMLYDGAIRHVSLALEALAAGHRRYDEVNNHVIAAQDILSELTASLDFDKGGALAKNLFSLYSFMNRRLLEGNLRKEEGPLTEVRKHLGTLREAWAEISTREGLEEKTVPETGVNIAG